MHEIRSVLAASDLSGGSDTVVSAAATLASSAGARLHVLHVVGLTAAGPSLGLTPRTDAAIYEEQRTRAERLLSAQLERCVEPGQEALPAVIEGTGAPRAICDHAETVHADVIVIGPHGKGEAGPELLGTTADAVLRSAPAPVLVVRAGLTMPPLRVLVPSDPAEPVAGIMEVALGWARAFAPPADGTPVSVEVVHVLLDPMGGRKPFDRAMVMPGDNPEIDAARERARGIDVRELVLFGDRVEETILGYARETRPDLLVAASHGYGLIKRALLGGTSSVLARRAPCSVLLVPPALWSESAGTGRHPGVHEG